MTSLGNDSDSVQLLGSDGTNATVSRETFEKEKAENEKNKQIIAVLQASKEKEDAKILSKIVGLKPTVTESVAKLENDKSNAPYTEEIGAMKTWASKMDNGDSLEANLMFGRMVSCFSAQTSKLSEERQLEKDKAAGYDLVQKRACELEEQNGLLKKQKTESDEQAQEHSRVADSMRNELARLGRLQEKVDFSMSSRRNANDGGESLTAPQSATLPNVTDDTLSLFSYVQQGSGGARMRPSGTAHHMLGNTEGSDAAALQEAIASANAMR
jgi:hypothetical protein